MFQKVGNQLFGQPQNHANQWSYKQFALFQRLCPLDLLQFADAFPMQLDTSHHQ